MTWSYLRRDFLPPLAICTFCRRPLHSEKGIVITDEVGSEAFAGPSCAKKHLGQPEERLLDVSRLALLVVADEPAQHNESAPTSASPAPEIGAGSSPTSSPQRPPLPPIDEVVQYVRLRCEAMNGFKFAVSKVLKLAHDEYKQSGEIEDDLRKQIGGAMRNAAANKSVLSPINVKRCIGLNHWLVEAVQHTNKDRREFLEQMQSHLHRFWMLTPKQMAAINRWGEHIRKRIDDFPLLDEEAFSGITLPEFMQRNTSSRR